MGRRDPRPAQLSALEGPSRGPAAAGGCGRVQAPVPESPRASEPGSRRWAEGVRAERAHSPRLPGLRPRRPRCPRRPPRRASVLGPSFLLPGGHRGENSATAHRHLHGRVARAGAALERSRKGCAPKGKVAIPAGPRPPGLRKFWQLRGAPYPPS